MVWMIFSTSLFSLVCVVALKLIRGGNSLSLSSRPFTFCLRWSLVFLLSPRPSLFLFVYIKRSALFISNPLKYPNGESQRPTKRYRQKHPNDTGVGPMFLNVRGIRWKTFRFLPLAAILSLSFFILINSRRRAGFCSAIGRRCAKKAYPAAVFGCKMQS